MKTRILIMLAFVTLLVACKGKSSGDYEFTGNLENAKSSAADTAIMPASLDKTPVEKLVKTAQISFKVKNVRQVSENIATLTAEYGGMVMHQQVQSTANGTRDVHISNDSIMRVSAYNTTAEMAVRVPSGKLEDFITKVSHMGTYLNISKMDIDDRSLDYLSTQLKLNDRKELIDAQKNGKVVIKKVGDVLDLKDDLVDKKIANMATDAAVKYSVVNVSFYQSNAILKEIIANDDPSAYNMPVFQRIGLALSGGWSVFIDVMVAMLNLWVFILGGIAIWRAVAFYKRKSRLSNTNAA